ncbi:MAG: SPOR domain-containing protein [Terriglobales bacterium]
MQDQDTEVTLGTGRLLALFFGLVVICALFFSAGFSLGRKSAAPVTATTTSAPVPAPVATEATAKPGPSKSQAAPSTSDEMTFYKSVDQNDPKPQLEQPAPSAPASVADNASAKPVEIAKPAPLGSGYMVQIAAVSKQEDADALVNALRKKQYPVFASTVPTDKLYHVQVGPFGDIKDADAMKSRLTSDGYNPIVKK